jgi:RND family efflux transporter MFP subunit
MHNTSRRAQLAALAVLLISAACGRARPAEKQARPVRVESVRREGPPAGTRYSATIQPYEQVPLAFKVSGYVRTIAQRAVANEPARNLQQGDEVARGATLAQIDEQDYRQRVRQAQAHLAETEAGLQKAAADAGRAEQLYASQSLTRPDYDSARAALGAAQARVEGARAQLESAEIALRDCALVVPRNGVVLSRNIEVGSLVAPGTLGFVVADLTRVKAVFGVPDRLVQRIQPGAELAVTSESFADAPLRGRVSAVSPSADAQSRVFSVEVTIPNPQRRLKAGMIATVEVAPPADAGTLTGLTISLGAVVKSVKTSGGYAVFVADGTDERATARARDVTLGQISGNRVAVSTGLSAGERVVVTGASLLADGDALRVIPGDGE